jgi:FkbM family methyltransferase
LLRALIRAFLEPLRKNGIFDVPTAIAKGRVVTRSVNGIEVRWLVTNSSDEIQSKQIASGFYELTELEQLSKDVGPRQTVLDVGANIGNHSVFFLTHMGCRRLIAIEPFLPAYRHLLANLALNSTARVDVAMIGAALGVDEGTANLVPPTRFNIGLTRVDPGPGDVRVLRGDDHFLSTPIDLIKIDVEGMEIEVLSGLSETIARHRPAIYVEAGRSTRSALLELLGSAGYRLVREAPAYGTQFNLTLLPAEGTP